MDGSNGAGPYPEVFLRTFTAAVKLRNWIAGKWQSLRLRFGGIGKAVPEEPEAFEEISELIPNLKLYNAEGVRGWLRRRALLKGFNSLKEYSDYLRGNDEELADLRENLTFVGTNFFRGSVWPELRTVVQEDLSQGRHGNRIRVWCAGCSSGKEVYSLLMTLLDYVPAQSIELLATDYNDVMLSRCKDGIFPIDTMDGIPKRYWHYMERYSGIRPAGGLAYRFCFRFDEQLRGLVRIQHLDLLTDDYPSGFDLIFCRNVIKFFDSRAIRMVQEKLADSLVSGGLLVVSEEAREQIEEPKSLGLERLDLTCIYRKNG